MEEKIKELFEGVTLASQGKESKYFDKDDLKIALSSRAAEEINIQYVRSKALKLTVSEDEIEKYFTENCINLDSKVIDDFYLNPAGIKTVGDFIKAVKKEVVIQFISNKLMSEMVKLWI